MLIPVIVGTVLGFLAGLGVGGGSLLILWLTYAVKIDTPNARAINLLFFLPAALISCLFRRKQGNLRFIKMLPAIGTACITAAIFSWVSPGLNTNVMKKIFGGILILVGLRELFSGRGGN